MGTRLTRRAALIDAFGVALLYGLELTADQKQKIDAALAQAAPAKPKQARRQLVTNLSCSRTILKCSVPNKFGSSTHSASTIPSVCCSKTRS